MRYDDPKGERLTTNSFVTANRKDTIMNLTAIHKLDYATLRKHQGSSAFRMAEIPIEHSISLGLPTLRWGCPAYAFFAGPALKRRGQPVQQGVPDRWWAVDPRSEHLLAYALVAALPFADEGTAAVWVTVTLPLPDGTVEQLRERLATIDAMMDTLAPRFFAGEPVSASARSALAEILIAHIPAPLLPPYRALTPDFWAWLEA